MAREFDEHEKTVSICAMNRWVCEQLCNALVGLWQ